MALFQFGFQLIGLVEMVFDAAFVAAGHKHQFGAAGGYGLFHCILNQRLIHNRQHFFGAGLGGGQKARAHPGHGEDGFLNWNRIFHGFASVSVGKMPHYSSG